MVNHLQLFQHFCMCLFLVYRLYFDGFYLLADLLLLQSDLKHIACDLILLILLLNSLLQLSSMLSLALNLKVLSLEPHQLVLQYCHFVHRFILLKPQFINIFLQLIVVFLSFLHQFFNEGNAAVFLLYLETLLNAPLYTLKYLFVVCMLLHQLLVLPQEVTVFLLNHSSLCLFHPTLHLWQPHQQLIQQSALWLKTLQLLLLHIYAYHNHRTFHSEYSSIVCTLMETVVYQQKKILFGAFGTPFTSYQRRNVSLRLLLKFF